MADINIRIGAKLDGLQRSIKKAQSQLNRFADFAEKVGTDLTTRLTLPILGVGAAAVKTFADFDRMEKGLAALNGSAAAGAAQFDRLNSIVLDTRTTLDLKTAALGAQRLQGAGKSAAFAERTIKQLGIAATVSGSSVEDVGGVIRQFTQILGKGKIEQEDLNSILDRMPALGALIKQEFGASTAEGIRDTGISMDAFVSRLTTAIEKNEQFQNVQGGLAKAFESFTNSLQVALKPLGEAIAKAINLEENLKRLSDFVSRTAKAFAELPPDLQRTIIGVVALTAALGPLLLGLGAVTRVSVLFGSGLKTLSGVAGILLGPIGKLAKGVLGIYGRFRAFLRLGIFGQITKLSVAFNNLVKVLNPVRALIALVAGSITTAYARSETFRATIGRLFTAIKELVNVVLAPFKNSLGGISDIALKVAGAVAVAVSAIVDFATAAVRLIKGVGTAIALAFQRRWTEAGQAIKDGWNGAGDALEGFGQRAKKIFTEITTGTGSFEVPTIAGDLSGGGGDGSGGGGGGSRAAGIVAPLRTAIEEVRSFGAETQGIFRELNKPIDQLGVAFQELPVQLTAAEETIQDYQGAIQLAADKNRVLGDSFGLLQQKINITRTAIADAVEEYGVNSEVVAQLSDQLAVYNEQMDKINAQQERFNILAGGIEQLGETFGSILESGAASFKKFAAAALNAIADIIGALIKQGVAAAITGSIQTAPGPVGLALAAAAGGIASSLLKGAIAKISPPKLARGGLAFGPTLAVVGDNVGASSDPEVIAPLSKLKDYIGGGGNGEFVLRGSDLILAMDRANYNRSRRTGG